MSINIDDSCGNKAYRGIDTTFPFDLSDALGDSIDLVGDTARFTLKSDRKAADSTASLIRDFLITSDDLDADNDKLLNISFTAAEMSEVDEKSYYYDLKIFDPDGKTVVYVPYVEINIIDDVTDRFGAIS
ncbi:hypothetical protein DVS77_21540 [Mycolicibacterium moriokaense]|nr:hypothetical protein DVS77_21540 [Mycolicibacterium moriokaense]